MFKFFISILVISFLAVVSSQHQALYPHFQPSQLNPPQSRAQPQPQPQPQPQSRPQPQLRSQQPPQRIESRPPQQPQVAPQTHRYVPFSIPAPPAQSSPPYTYGYHKIIDPSTNQVLYHRYYNTDNKSHYEARSWYNAGNQAAQPIVARALADPYQVPFTNLPAPREPVFRSPFQPAPLTNVNYQTNRQPLNQRDVDQQDYRRSAENSIEYSSPVISRYSVPSWLDNIETLVSYIKSPTFISQVGKLGSQLFFRSQVVADDSTEDDKLISYNKDHSGLNFTSNNKDDCKPKLTTIKLGSPERPEIIYNPSSVEILRCPQACFSWQFDCVPTKKATYNFTVATYLINGEALKTRKVDQFTIESHVACACQCRSVASCLGNITFSPQRLPVSP